MSNVHSPDARRRVSRLPFIVADLALLAAILVIVLLGGRPLDPLVAGLAVLGVIAAAVLGVAPWAMESWGQVIRTRDELREAVDAQFELQGNVLDDLRARSRSLHDLVDKARASEAGPAWAPLAGEIDKLREELSALGETLAERTEEAIVAAGKSASEAAAGVAESSSTLVGKRLGNLGESLAALKEEFHGAGTRTEAMVGELSLLRDDLAALGARIDGLATAVAAAAETARLALEASAAASAPPASTPVIVSEPVVEPALVPAAAVDEPPPAEVSEAPPVVPTTVVDVVPPPVVVEAAAAPSEGPSEPPAGTGPEPEPEAPRKARKAKPAPPPEPSLFDLSGEVGSGGTRAILPGSGELRRAAGSEGGGVRLVAHVNIGAGDFPYVRGEGGGLRVDKGTPLRFVEIGVWEWKAERVSGPVVVRLFRNDRDPATEEAQVLMPGERLDWAPAAFEEPAE